MYIRVAKPEDLPEIEKIYAYAREAMRQSGNPNQWGTDRPLPAAIMEDLRREQSFLVIDGEEICGIFAFIIGEDSTYAVIEEGNWLNEEPYGVIHRIAGNGKARGVLQQALIYAEDRVPNLRIDTHEDNKIMQHLLEKYGFSKCGVIYTDNGTPRLAYQKKFS